MRISYSTLDKLRSMPNYSIHESKDLITIFYFAPSIGEASGTTEEGGNRSIEIILGKDNNGLTFIEAKVLEGDRVIRKMSEEELDLWFQFIEGE
ncbi:hypothetical protein CM19_06545 [Candidatus Acidianus copahuensis]|uniref:Uncharacterized protein n=1 Tax=Candidatus Acidianus copahuensis TaxID=1160895 RepID=A0A031LPK4_9CREN|nr:hypothetical protein [Candidatus Acidianus copahuensis]EZQ07012.1 hypothetical protein CM19_06545 [Candidatus Acidianus copahuensis]